MNSKLIIACIIGGSAILTGCKKDFLDAQPSQFISADQLIEASELDPNLLNGNIGGLYTTMYTPGVGGTTGHDDFGQKGIDIYTDMLCSDMVLGALNYGWYAPVARYQASKDFTRTENYVPWRYYYRIIFGANTVIDALGGTDAEQTETDKRHIVGQAKAMRAYGYFYLSQIYTPEYGDGTVKILPIYTNTEVPNQPKSTSKEVYDLMVADLRQAIEYLDDFTRATKDQVDKTVAQGLLAYVLAARGSQEDLNEVVTLTDEIIASGYPLTTKSQSAAVLNNGVLTNPESGFNNIITPSWIWGVDLTIASNLDLISWWGQVDYYTYSYAWAGDPKVMDAGLQASIAADDVRKTQFNSTGRPLYKFFDPGRTAGGQRVVVTDYVYMRADEFYLLNAEANAKLGQDVAARESLKALLAERVPDNSFVDALSGAALQDEIYHQTRIELWGEGKSYLALKRDKKTATRGANHLFEAGNSFPYNSVEMNFPIPQAEVINNPVLGN